MTLEATDIPVPLFVSILSKRCVGMGLNSQVKINRSETKSIKERGGSDASF